MTFSELGKLKGGTRLLYRSRVAAFDGVVDKVVDGKAQRFARLRFTDGRINIAEPNLKHVSRAPAGSNVGYFRRKPIRKGERTVSVSRLEFIGRQSGIIPTSEKPTYGEDFIRFNPDEENRPRKKRPRWNHPWRKRRKCFEIPTPQGQKGVVFRRRRRFVA